MTDAARLKVADRVKFIGNRHCEMLVVHVTPKERIAPEPDGGDEVTVVWLDQVQRPQRATYPAAILRKISG